MRDPASTRRAVGGLNGEAVAREAEGLGAPRWVAPVVVEDDVLLAVGVGHLLALHGGIL